MSALSRPAGSRPGAPDGSDRLDQPGGPAPWTVDGSPPGRSLSGAQLRAAAALLVLLSAAVAVAGDSADRFSAPSVLAGLLVVAGTALAPTTPVPTLGLLALAAVVVDRSPALWHVVLLAALLHAVHLLVSWCAAVPVRARLPVSALGPTVHRFAVAQLLAAPAALAVAVGAPSPAAGASGAAAVAAGIVLVAVSVLLARAGSAAGRRRV